MNEKGLTIYLNRSKASIIDRLLKGIHKRPLLTGMNKQQLETFFDEKMKDRKVFYEKAKLQVGDADVEEIFKIIENATF
jgi:shikimate kinase